MRALYAGRIGSPHGLDGSFVVVDPNVELLDGVADVLVDGVPRGVRRRAGHPGRYLLALDGVQTREAAAALRGLRLEVARANAPALSADEWWADDLEGLVVRDGERVVGVVRRLLAMPSCELLEVDRSTLGGEDLLVPLVSDAVRFVDLEAGSVDIDLEFLDER